MKIHSWILFSLFAVFVAASRWLSEDYEIFKLNDQVRADLGQDVSFYQWLKVSPKATREEIQKAYRRLSKKIHPDKFSAAKLAVKKLAEERYQRLSAVGNILRDHGLRKRYDYFHSNGFPKWKQGSGYLFSRFRPGFILTLTILFIITSVLQYFALRISRSQDYKRVKDLKDQVKFQAWGGSLVPPTDGSSRRVGQDGSGKLFLVEADGNVYLEENGEPPALVDEHDVLVSPHWKELILYTFPVFLYNQSVARVVGSRIEAYVPPRKEKPAQSGAEDKKKRKKQPKGKKVTLPSGKVIYQRPT